MKFVFFARIVWCANLLVVAAATLGATLAGDIEFLKTHTDVLVLQDKAGTVQVAVAPQWQGRVVTSGSADRGTAGYGWINRELIASGVRQAHINALGGEDRFWMGPEGGQFSVFFASGAPFDFEHWFTPAAFDTEPFKVVEQTPEQVTFTAEFELKNHSATDFHVQVDRRVRVLEAAEVWQRLQVTPNPKVRIVAFETENRVTNRGQTAWKKETGLLSIWILGMLNPSPATTIVVPIKSGPEKELGPKVTSDYFGEIPRDRLVVREGVVFLAADGKFRSKIGINPRRSQAVLGSFDADHDVLTIVQFSQPAGVTDYVNSLWKLQDNPYGGDAANSYNDGPTTPGGKPLGPFYELESSSPAAALAPGESLTHTHRTIHLRGERAALDAVARAKLGVSLDEITSALR